MHLVYRLLIIAAVGFLMFIALCEIGALLIGEQPSAACIFCGFK